MSSSAAAQRAPVYKDATLATVLSFIVPGAGQVYAGRTGKGLALFAVAAIGAGIVVHDQTCTAGPGCGSSTGVGAAIALVAWGTGLLTAGHDARVYNERVDDELQANRAKRSSHASFMAAARFGESWRNRK